MISKLKNNSRRGKKGQVTIFIIIAIVIVATVILIFVFRDSLFRGSNISEFSPIYDFFDQCIKEKTLNGLQLSGFQGGYINVPKFEAGSKFAPSSSQLDFLGSPVPYWYYITGNGIVKEQVPSKQNIEKRLGEYLDSELRNCDFSLFISQGFVINNSIPTSQVSISATSVDVNVKMNLFTSKGESSGLKANHNVKVDSSFGKFFALALEIYQKEKKDSVLENFSVDILQNYAPVTGTELSCKPLIWDPTNVTADLREALSANVAALKVGGNYYTLKNAQEKYFVINGLKADSGENVNFMYNPGWPTRIEVWPVDGNLMIAKPVGLESGLGIIGFCYVPYHFVYDMYYPVLIQIYNDDELFQFPVSVVVDKSVAKKSIYNGEAISREGTMDQFCDLKSMPLNVYTYDSNLNPVEANLKFRCIETECSIGSTKINGKDSVFSGNFPQCINGQIVAEAEGYVHTEYIVSTNEVTTANILMNKIYSKPLRIFIDGQEVSENYNGLILVSFDSGDSGSSQNVVYPDYKEMKLSEGFYNVSVQVFRSSSLTIPASSTKQCVKTLSPGLFGFFGKTSEQCFDINIPAQTLDNALSAGGKTSDYILESDLKDASYVELNLKSLPVPSTLDQLQRNYDLYEVNPVEVNLR